MAALRRVRAALQQLRPQWRRWRDGEDQDDDVDTGLPGWPGVAAGVADHRPVAKLLAAAQALPAVKQDAILQALPPAVMQAAVQSIAQDWLLGEQLAHPAAPHKRRRTHRQRNHEILVLLACGRLK